MDRYKKLAELLKTINKGTEAMPLFNAEVKSVQGESCTVAVNDIELDEVRLKATINGNANKIIIEPKNGSMVLVGSLTGDLKDLAVLKVDEVAKLQYEQDGLKVLIDSTDGKVNIENGTASLKDVFQDLTDLLKQFQVYTAMGPSGTPIATTITSITNFETKFKSLLK